MKHWFLLNLNVFIRSAIIVGILISTPVLVKIFLIDEMSPLEQLKQSRVAEYGCSAMRYIGAYPDFCTPEQVLEEKCNRNPARCLQSMEVKLSRVVDGDTIVIEDISSGQKDRVRLIKIDTPEMNGRCEQEIELANRAKKFVQNTIPVGGIITLTSEVEGWTRDQYNRVLAEVSYQDVDLGTALLASELARPWPLRNPWCGGK